MHEDVRGGPAGQRGDHLAHHGPRGRAVQINPIKLKLTPPGSKRLKLKCDVLLSTFAFKINLRRYHVVVGGGQDAMSVTTTSSKAGKFDSKIFYKAGTRPPPPHAGGGHQGRLTRDHTSSSRVLCSVILPCATMSKCVKPLRHLAISSTKSSKWSVLIGLAGRLRTKSHEVSEWFHALCHTRCYYETAVVAHSGLDVDGAQPDARGSCEPCDVQRSYLVLTVLLMCVVFPTARSTRRRSARSAGTSGPSTRWRSTPTGAPSPPAARMATLASTTSTTTTSA